MKIGQQVRVRTVQQGCCGQLLAGTTGEVTALYFTSPFSPKQGEPVYEIDNEVLAYEHQLEEV